MIRIHQSITRAKIIAAVQRAGRTTDNPGFCIACGAEVGGVEPDAAGDRCESCGAPGVYGAEQLMIERES